MPWPSRWGVLPRPKGDGVSADIVLFIDPPFLALYPRAPPPEEVPIPWIAQACRPEAALLAPQPWLRTLEYWTLASDPHAIPAPFRRPEEAPPPDIHLTGSEDNPREPVAERWACLNLYS